MDEIDCLFCRIIRKEIPARIVFEDSGILAFEDIKPQAPVHILIIPKAHIDKTSDLTEADTRVAGELILAAKIIAEERAVEAAGYRIVMNCGKDAGQEVSHLHLHLLGGRKFAWPPG